MRQPCRAGQGAWLVSPHQQVEAPGARSEEPTIRGEGGAGERLGLAVKSRWAFTARPWLALARRLEVSARAALRFPQPCVNPGGHENLFAIRCRGHHGQRLARAL